MSPWSGFVMRAIVLYGVSLILTVGAPSLFFAEEYARTQDGCVAFAGAVMLIVLVPIAVVGWGLHVLVNALMSRWRHRGSPEPRGVLVDTFRGGITAVVMIVCATSALVALGWLEPPVGDAVLIYLDLGAVTCTYLLGCLVGWRLGVAARKATATERAAAPTPTGR